MRDLFRLPVVCQIALLIIFVCQTTPTCKSQRSNRQNDDHVSTIDSEGGGAKLPIHNFIESILRQINLPSGNANIVVHINNLYCVSGSKDVQINPCKHQTINIARGDQIVNFDGPRELAKRSLPGKGMSNNKQLTNEPHNVTSVDWKTVSGNTARERHTLPEKHLLQSDQPGAQTTRKQVPLEQSEATPKKPVPDGGRQPENRDSFHVDIPALNIFIDGKPLTDTSKTKPTTSSDELSSKLFKEELKTLLEGNGNSVGKRLLCDSTEEPSCDDDLVTFRGGLEISYDEFRKILEDVSERPDFVKLIVPGGVTGPLTGYFQKVDKSLHEQALVHGVCLLDNGLLVPLRAMLRILKLHAWLCEMIPDFKNDGVSKLHASISRTRTDSIVDLLRCFVKSNKIHVMLPGSGKVPFAQFEQEEEHIPIELQRRAKIEMLGFHIPYTNFRDKLVALCKDVAN